MVRTRSLSQWVFTAAVAVFSLSSVVSRAAAPNAKSVLPAPTAVKGWKRIGPIKVYNSQNLFNLIDGEAEAVLGYSFVSCAHAEYAPVRQSRPVLTIDVFDMGDPLNAFGLFGSDRISGKPAGIGAESVRIEPSGLNFRQGRYVTRTAIVQVNPANRAAQTAFARACAAKIGAGGGVPPLLKALPPGRQPRSEKYIRKDVAGHAFLKNAVAARYPALGQGAELFIAQYPSPAQAKAALDAYRSYEKSGTGLAPLKGVGNGGFIVSDRFAKTVAAAQKGRYLVGVHHVRSAASAQSLLKQAVTRLGK